MVIAVQSPELIYSFSVPNGRYLVTLVFANPFTGPAAAGGRVFDIELETAGVYSRFEQVVAGGGCGEAVVRSAVVFVCAALANLLTVFIPPPPAAEAALPVILHAAFIVRVVRARRAAARQRGNELEMFKRVRAEGPAGTPPAPSR